jgi:hypothetical protein
MKMGAWESRAPSWEGSKALASTYYSREVAFSTVFRGL